jgi:quercetin dioxygenase-like cupin family protein
MERWDLGAIDTPGGKASPVVLGTADQARAVLIELQPGQALRDHEVKEGAWILVLSGSATFESEAERAEGGAGTLARFAPAERRAVSSPGGARLLLFLAPWPGAGHYRAEEQAVGGIGGP